MGYLATIRDKKGKGNDSLHVRIRNGALQYWNFYSNEWVSGLDESTPEHYTMTDLTEFPDSDPLESRYAAIVELPCHGSVILEYVSKATGRVIGEETPLEPRLDEVSKQATLARKMQTNKAWLSPDQRYVFILDDNEQDVIVAFEILDSGKSRNPMDINQAQALYDTLTGGA